jgi:hypothetical protein
VRHPEGFSCTREHWNWRPSPATGHFPARRSAPKRSEDTTHQYLGGLLPQNVTPDAQKGRRTRRNRNWSQFLREVPGIPHAGRLSAGQVVAVIYPDARVVGHERDVVAA